MTTREPTASTADRGSATEGAAPPDETPTDDGDASLGEDETPTDESEASTDADEAATRVPRVDAAESVAVLLVPTVLGGVWAAASGGGPDGTLAGTFAGGAVGWLLVRLRLRFEAVRTDEGVARRRRPADAEWAAQLTAWEYDPRYDRFLAAALAVVGAGAFGAVAVVEAADGVLLRLVVVGHVSLVAALLVYGVSNRE
jgi:hypothetical protein